MRAGGRVKDKLGARLEEGGVLWILGELSGELPLVVRTAITPSNSRQHVEAPGRWDGSEAKLQMGWVRIQACALGADPIGGVFAEAAVVCMPSDAVDKLHAVDKRSSGQTARS